MFEFIDSREKGYAPQLQRICSAGSHRIELPCETEDEAVTQEAHDCPDVVDGALLYITSAMFNMLHTLIKYNPLYTLKDEELSDWLEVTKCHLETRMFS